MAFLLDLLPDARRHGDIARGIPQREMSRRCPRLSTSYQYHFYFQVRRSDRRISALLAIRDQFQVKILLLLHVSWNSRENFFVDISCFVLFMAVTTAGSCSRWRPRSPCRYSCRSSRTTSATSSPRRTPSSSRFSASTLCASEERRPPASLSCSPSSGRRAGDELMMNYSQESQHLWFPQSDHH